MVLKGEIPWYVFCNLQYYIRFSVFHCKFRCNHNGCNHIFRTKDLKVEAKNFRIFFIHTVRIILHTLVITPPRLKLYLFQVVQTQTTTAYCRILPTLDHHV